MFQITLQNDSPFETIVNDLRDRVKREYEDLLFRLLHKCGIEKEYFIEHIDEFSGEKFYDSAKENVVCETIIYHRGLPLFIIYEMEPTMKAEQDHYSYITTYKYLLWDDCVK